MVSITVTTAGITHDFHTDHKIGSFLSCLMGLSVCWWKSDHNTHHIVCNAIEHDPNIQHMPMMAIHEKIFKEPFFDTYHKRFCPYVFFSQRFSPKWWH